MIFPQVCITRAVNRQAGMQYSVRCLTNAALHRTRPQITTTKGTEPFETTWDRSVQRKRREKLRHTLEMIGVREIGT